MKNIKVKKAKNIEYTKKAKVKVKAKESNLKDYENKIAKIYETIVFYNDLEARCFTVEELYKSFKIYGSSYGYTNFLEWFFDAKNAGDLEPVRSVAYFWIKDGAQKNIDIPVIVDYYRREEDAVTWSNYNNGYFIMENNKLRVKIFLKTLNPKYVDKLWIEWAADPASLYSDSQWEETLDRMMEEQ